MKRYIYPLILVVSTTFSSLTAVNDHSPAGYVLIAMQVKEDKYFSIPPDKLPIDARIRPDGRDVRWEDRFFWFKTKTVPYLMTYPEASKEIGDEVMNHIKEHATNLTTEGNIQRRFWGVAHKADYDFGQIKTILPDDIQTIKSHSDKIPPIESSLVGKVNILGQDFIVFYYPDFDVYTFGEVQFIAPKNMTWQAK